MTALCPGEYVEVLDDVAAGLVDRDDVVRLLGLCLLAGEHAYLLGPPGVAKTQLLTELAARVAGARFAVADLAGPGVKEDVVGPVDVPALLGRGEWHRRPEGFLPDAHLGLLDELDVADPRLTDLLLRLLAQRRWRDGTVEVDAPLLCAVGAGNGLPVSDRLWDRFTARMVVEDLDAGGMAALLDDLEDGNRRRAAAGGGVVDLDRLRAAGAAAAAMRTSPTVRRMAVVARAVMVEAGVAVSARRLAAGMRLVKAQAWLAGAEEVAPEHLGVLGHVLWQRPEQAGLAAGAVRAATGAADDAVEVVRGRLAAVTTAVASLRRWGPGRLESLGLDVEEELAGVGVELDRLAAEGVEVADARAHCRGLHGLLVADLGVGAG